MFGYSSAYCKGLNTQSKQQRAQRTALWNTTVWMEGVTSVCSGEELGHELKLLLRPNSLIVSSVPSQSTCPNASWSSSTTDFDLFCLLYTIFSNPQTLEKEKLPWITPSCKLFIQSVCQDFCDHFWHFSTTQYSRQHSTIRLCWFPITPFYLCNVRSFLSRRIYLPGQSKKMAEAVSSERTPLPD